MDRSPPRGSSAAACRGGGAVWRGASGSAPCRSSAVQVVAGRHPSPTVTSSCTPTVESRATSHWSNGFAMPWSSITSASRRAGRRAGGRERFKVDLDRHSYMRHDAARDLHRPVGEPGLPARRGQDRRDRMRHRFVDRGVCAVRRSRLRLRHLGIVDRRRPRAPRRSRDVRPGDAGRAATGLAPGVDRTQPRRLPRRHRAPVRRARAPDDRGADHDASPGRAAPPPGRRDRHHGDAEPPDVRRPAHVAAAVLPHAADRPAAAVRRPVSAVRLRRQHSHPSVARPGTRGDAGPDDPVGPEREFPRLRGRHRRRERPDPVEWHTPQSHASPTGEARGTGVAVVPEVDRS